MALFAPWFESNFRNPSADLQSHVKLGFCYFPVVWAKQSLQIQLNFFVAQI